MTDGAALLIGGAGAACFLLGLHYARLQRERATVALTLGFIASYYPVFALGHGSDLVFHSAIFAGFALFSILAAAHAPGLVPLGLLGHGLFDLFMSQTPHPGPEWWPVFCGTFDILIAIYFMFIATRDPQS